MLLVAIAAVIYHLAVGRIHAVLWWIMVGIFGTGIFQALCIGGLEPVAWVLMLIPVLIVCFFLAVALFASRMRIENVELRNDCDECPCGGNPSCQRPECPCRHRHQRRSHPCENPECPGSCPYCRAGV